jgi:hypothetical protein
VGRHDDDRPLVGLRTQEREDPFPVAVIELRRRLVREQDARADCHTMGHRHPLLLSTRQLLDKVVT